ncbi:hypothetical protein VTK73DRAFT_8527 [Phialemonium thermophilum]|uniref:Fork-head domain-containing protein n=1 Tax=Phialemonium thermophilum TaxID=223376 RepID=A0ABR3W8A6_9PEZI
MAKPPQFAADGRLHIFHDDFSSQSLSTASHAPIPRPSPAKKRKPLQNANRNVILNPPHTAPAKQSPFKSAASRAAGPALTPLQPSQGTKLNMVPAMPPTTTARPPSTDSLEKKQPLMSRFKTVAQKPGHGGPTPTPTPTPTSTSTAAPPIAPAPHPTLAPPAEVPPRAAPGKRAAPPTLYPAPPSLNIAMEAYCPKPPGKRMLLEAAPIKEARSPKRQCPDSSPLPPPDAFPPIVDDGTKPAHSYAQLIGMAILRSPQRRLTLSQIYTWISNNFSFYSVHDAGWQNSIRHNLSLNKHFIKQERPKHDPGKGNYWAIEPGMEHLFMKEKVTRKSTTTTTENNNHNNNNMSVMSSSRLEPPHSSSSHLPTIPEQSSLPNAHSASCQSSLPPLPPPPPPSSQAAAHGAPPSQELSSDATIPVSDHSSGPEDGDRPPPEATDNGNDDDAARAAKDASFFSPLPAAMHSSPPIPKHVDLQRHSGTPPPFPRNLGSSVSRSRSHKRKFASMDDSGYISSLESSVMRPQQHAKLLTSEADRPRIKRGRAEEEIARLRASSYDSPSKGRPWPGYAPHSSSPLRQHSSNDGGHMLPPLTPAMKLKAPPKAPPSVSPSTNLRLHRESVRSMIESPYRRVASILPKAGDTALQLTPGFNLDEVFYGVDRRSDGMPADGADFDIFQDVPFGPMFALSPAPGNSNGSPVKRSAKRQRMDRSQSTSALNDISNGASPNPFGHTNSFLRVPGQNNNNNNNNTSWETPSKVFDSIPSSPSKLFLQSPSKAPPEADVENIAPWISLDDLCSPEFLEDNDFAGIDMLAGFEKIGSGSAAQNAQPPRQPRNHQKPGLGRSYTTTF